jgi:hypothetical protein
MATKRTGVRGEYKKATETRETQKKTILSWLSRGFSEGGAVARAGLSYTQYLKWKKEDDVFRADVEVAKGLGTNCLEDVATSRAKRKSDILLMFLLKKRDPSYRDNTPNVTVPVTVVARRYA